MSRMARLSLVRPAVYRVPHRGVASKPTSPFNRRIAQGIDSPSGVTRSASNFLYANFFRRNAVFLTGVIGAAVVFTGAYDAAMDAMWEWNNQGKLFKDVIPTRFPNLPPNTEPEGGEEDAGETSADDEPKGSDEEAEAEKAASGQREEEQPAAVDEHRSAEDVQKMEDVKAKGTQRDGNDAKNQTPVQRLESKEGDLPKDDMTEHNKQVNRMQEPTPPNAHKKDDKKEEKQEEKKTGGDEKKEEKKGGGGDDQKGEKKAAEAKKPEEAKRPEKKEEKKEEKKPQTTEGNSAKSDEKKDEQQEKKPGQHDTEQLQAQGQKAPKNLKDHQDQSTPRGKAANEKPKSAETGADDSTGDQKKAGRTQEEKHAGGVKHNQSMADRDAATGDVTDKASKVPGGADQEERKEAKEQQKALNKLPAAEKK